MSSKEQDYRTKARECDEHARAAITGEVKDQYRELARQWRAMVSKRANLTKTIPAVRPRGNVQMSG
jgi:hypothetical protein